MSKAERPKSQRVKSCVLVLGGDGPASTATSGILGSLGCEIPKSVETQVGAMPESPRIYDFNDGLLASAGSSRDDFTPFYKEWLQSPRAPEFLDRAIALLHEEFGSVELFVMSDPSICRLLPFWIEALERFGCTPQAVIVTRNPMEAARSANRQDNGALSQMVWLRNMLAAESNTRDMRRACTSFEELMKGWASVAGKVEHALQLVWPRPVASVEFEVASLLDRIRRDEGALAVGANGVPLPAWLQETSDILSRWAEHGEDLAIMRRSIGSAPSSTLRPAPLRVSSAARTPASLDYHQERGRPGLPARNQKPKVTMSPT